MNARATTLPGSAAADLVRHVHDDPAAPLGAAVCAPGGYGKTTLLAEIAADYRAAGVAVGTPWQPAGDYDVLLVDDAHLIDAARLREIARRAEQPGARVVVAYRPWPRPAELAHVTDVLRRQRPLLSLPPLTAPQVAARYAGEVPPAWIDALLAQSGGVPRYLDRLVGALRDAGPAADDPSGRVPSPAAGNPSSRVPSPAAGGLPVAALAPFAAEFDDLDPEVLTVLLGVEAGAGLSVDLVAALLDRGADAAAAFVAAARATGMLAGNGTLVPLVRQALVVHGPVAQRIAIRQRLAGWQLARGGPVLGLVRPLLRLVSGPSGSGSDSLGTGLFAGPSAGSFAGPSAGSFAGPFAGPSAGSFAGPSAGSFAGPSAGPHDGPSAGSFAGPSAGPHDGPSAGSFAGPSAGPSAGPFAGLSAGFSADGSGAGLGDAFLAAGEEALREDPALAAELFAAAGRAGRPAGARHALATALAGNLDHASLLADQVLSGGPVDQRPEAACVAAAALAHRNQLARAVELYRWATPGPAAGFGALALAGTGRRDEAERLLAAAPDNPDAGPPTLLSTAATQMGRGVCESVSAAPEAALSTLVQAAQLLEPSGSAVLLPDSPAALAALAAVQCAEFDTAHAVLDRALHTGLGGPLFVRRHRMLRAWTLMAQGRLAAAADEAVRAGAGPLDPDGRPVAAQARSAGADGRRIGADGRRIGANGQPVAAEGRSVAADGRAVAPDGRAVAPDGRIVALDGRAVAADTGTVALDGRAVAANAGTVAFDGRAIAADSGAVAARGWPEQGRDAVFAAALRIGLARRASDLVGLRAAWPAAAQALIGQPVDLFTLLPLGEITVAAARLGEQRQVRPALVAADELLERLGDPPLWSVPLHWARLHAAILADDRADAERHVAALATHRDRGPYAAALAAAAVYWSGLMSERIDPEQVEAAARALADAGLAWDGARLAGQAAIRTPDRKAMTALLDCARSLQARQAPAGDADAPARRGARDGGAVRPVLSDREQEVATLVLAGLTYKQVADRLYISAKTVEHHMARIRQRLGCTDRRELLARLRTLTTEPTEGRQP